MFEQLAYIDRTFLLSWKKSVSVELVKILVDYTIHKVLLKKAVLPGTPSIDLKCTHIVSKHWNTCIFITKPLQGNPQPAAGAWLKLCYLYRLYVGYTCSHTKVFNTQTLKGGILSYQLGASGMSIFGQKVSSFITLLMHVSVAMY